MPAPGKKCGNMGKEKACPGRPAGNRRRIKCGIGGSGPPMMRPGFPSVSLCPDSNSYYPKSIRGAAVVFGGAFFRSAAAFSQQIPKVICERSCRMAKTLFVKITLKEEKKSGKPKKNQKKIDFFDDLLEKTLKKHMDSVRFRLFPLRPACSAQVRHRPEKSQFAPSRKAGVRARLWEKT